MSSPINRLAEYRTYSYHQFLLLCENSATAESITVGANNLSALQHPPGDRYATRSSSSGRYVTLIDGTSDAHLNITKSSWKTIITPDNKTGDNAFSGLGPNVDGIIDIYEPYGASFLGVIADASRDLGISQTILSFALKTIFIGHNQNGTYDYIHNVRPFVFTAYDISANFDSTGAKYRMLVIGQAGSGLSENQEPISGNSMLIEPNQSIFDALGQLESLIATSVDKNVAEYNKVQQRTGQSASEAKPASYKIHVSEEWKDIIMGDNENIKIHNSIGDPVLNIAHNGKTTIKQAIERILVSSSAVMSLQKSANAGSILEKRQVFSITDTTEIVNGERIYNYYVGLKNVITVPAGTDTSSEEAGLTFDYLFTGNNTDIITLNMKLMHGLQVISMVSTQQSMTDSISDRNGASVDAIISDPGLQSGSGSHVVPSQLEVGATFAQPHYSNVNYPVATSNFYNLLAKQAELDVIGTLITIHGNPTLLDEMTINPGDFNVNGLKERSRSELSINPNWINDPTFIKVNIMFPINPDDPSAGNQPFWYQGLYRVLSVHHTFVDGKFTQELWITSIAGSHPGQNGSEVSGGSAAQRSSAAGIDDEFDPSTLTPLPLESIATAPITDVINEDARLTDVLTSNEELGCDIFNAGITDPVWNYGCYGSELEQLRAIEVKKRLFVVHPDPNQAPEGEQTIPDADNAPVCDIMNVTNQQK